MDDLGDGEPLRLHADPPGQEAPEVWVHLPSGDLVGHLPPEVSDWLWPWLQEGGQAQVRTLRVRGAEVPSWRRVVIEVNCLV